MKILFSQLDHNFRSEVARYCAAADLNACFTCGSCSAGCPIHRVYPEYDPMKVVRMIHLGMKESVLKSEYIWYCATCHNCVQRCPQNVKFFDVLNVLKNIASKEGYAPSSWTQQTVQIMQTGIVFPTDEAWVKKRKAFSLPALKGDGTKAKKMIELAGLDKIKAKD